jgi:hypothetical protein
LENGYRHIDTAFVYQNEPAIGEALRKWFAKGGKRENLFITSKVRIFVFPFILCLFLIQPLYISLMSLKYDKL